MQKISYVATYRKDRHKVVIRVIKEGAVIKEIDPGIKITPNQWSDTEITDRKLWQRKIINHPNAKLLNLKIKNKITELEAEVTKADLLGLSLTKDKVKKLAEGRKVSTNFFEHCEPWIKEKYRNKGTRDAHLSDLNKLKAFAPNLSFGDIDKNFLIRYHNYMIQDLGNKGNTPWKSLKFIRTMLYDAGELAPNNPFKTKEYKMPAYKPTHKEGLYIAECKKLEEIFNEEVPVTYKIVAAKFLFMCYSGLRISDAKNFDVTKHIHNNERMVMVTQKEDVGINNKLHGRLKWILEVMASLPKKSMSDQYLNEWLKEIARHKGINRIKLTNHTGRHTFGCILAESGVPIEVAQKLLGHKDINSTKVYYRLRGHTVDKYAGNIDLIFGD